MKKIVIFITTFNRPDLLVLLLKDIHRESKSFDIDLLIINDHSTNDYSPVTSFLEERFSGRYHYIVNRQNFGKQYYWKTIANGFRYVADLDFEYFIQLPDDVRLVKSFFNRAIKSWDAITDKDKTCLSIAANFSRLMKPCWTSYQPHAVSFGNIDLIKTGWVDLCYISSRAFLQLLNFTIEPVDTRWTSRDGFSSGVGMQISRKLISQGHSIYSVKRSLVIHDHHPSVMHPRHREEVRLLTNHDMDKIVATMATMPGREESLRDVIASIIDQVDELRIYANNLHKKEIKLHIPPIYLHHRKLKWLFSDDHAGDLGDAGKFYHIEDIDGYHFTIDDDIIYPPDYVATMVEAVDRYERRCAVSLHGRTFGPGSIRSYYHCAAGQYSCMRHVAADKHAHVIGTGVLAYHTDTLRIPFSEFQASNMGDIWFSKYCQEKKIPRIILKHEAGWVKDSQNYDQSNTIYADNCKDDTLQTKVVNSVKWSL